MREQLLFLLVAFAMFVGLPATALGDCQVCRPQLMCDPGCTVTVMCKQAGNGELGGFCDNNPIFGCQMSNPCMLVDLTPDKLFSPLQRLDLKPAVFARASALRCS